MAKRRGRGSIKKAEKWACDLFGAHHVGGPGKPDCVTGRIHIEVKEHASALTEGQVRRELGKSQYRNAEVVMVCQVGRGGLSPNLVARASSLGLSIRRKGRAMCLIKTRR